MNCSRRSFLLCTAITGAGLAAASPGWASDAPLELAWKDLIPRGGANARDLFEDLGVVEHGQMSKPFNREAGLQVTDAFNGKLVRMPGYLVPLDYSGTGVTAALLVPFVGACIHVPPPPPNQLVYVTIADPYESRGLFEPVYVVGVFGIAATTTQLAEVGYSLSADLIEPYG